VRRYPRPRLRLRAPLWLLVAVCLLGGCSSPKEVAPSPTVTTTAAGTPPTPVQIGVSPSGVTTSLSAPASSTEEEYYQACHWARVWMSGRPGDPHAQIEPYLAMIQKSATGENGSWHTPWTKLPPERQAAIIVAAQAAADGGCD
jgi:hypothetical protein